VSNRSVPEVGGNLYSDLFGTSMDESMGSQMDVSEEYFKVDPELEQLDVMDLVMNDEIGADDPRILRLVAIHNDEEMQADRPGTSLGMESPSSADLLISPVIPAAPENPILVEETDQVVKRTRGRPRAGQIRPVASKVQSTPK